MKPSKRHLVLILFFFLWGLGGCDWGGQKEERGIQIGTNVWPGYEPLYLARALGKLDPAKVRLVEMASSSQVIRNLRNGLIDGGALTHDEQIILLESGLPVQAILVMDISTGGDVVLGQKEYQSMSDLKGKKVGVEETALGAYVLSRALEVNQMRPEEIEILNFRVNEHEAAFQSRAVDGIVTFEPHRSRLLAKGANQLFDSSQIPAEIFDVLVMKRESVERSPKIIQYLLQAWFFALDYMKQEPAKAAEILAARLKLRPSEVWSVYKGLRLPGLQENLHLLGKGFQTNTNRLAKAMWEKKLLPRPYRGQESATPRPLLDYAQQLEP